MSAFANLYVISKSNFDEYCKMARLVPYKPLPAGTRGYVRAVGPDEINSPAFKEKGEYYKKLWDFIHKNGKEPYEYKWSGYALADVLSWLKEAKNINLMEIQFMEAEGTDLDWIVFDETVKKKYLEQLNPTNFKEQDVLVSYQHLQEQQRDAVFKEMASKLSKEQLKMFTQMQKFDDENAVEHVRAMMDGIIILYKYMQLIDAQSVVILNIG